MSDSDGHSHILTQEAGVMPAFSFNLSEQGDYKLSARYPRDTVHRDESGRCEAQKLLRQSASISDIHLSLN